MTRDPLRHLVQRTVEQQGHRPLGSGEGERPLDRRDDVEPGWGREGRGEDVDRGDAVDAEGTPGLSQLAPGVQVPAVLDGRDAVRVDLSDGDLPVLGTMA